MAYKSLRQPFFFFFILSATIFVASLYHREITYDDAFFAEQAYWVNKVGYVRTQLFNDVMDWGVRQYIYLKLHVWQTALMARTFGWSAYIFKSAPLLYLLVFIYFAHFYYKRYLASTDAKSFYLFLALLLLNTYVVHFAFENRPEIMMMCVGFLSFLCMRQGIKFEKSPYIILSGILAGTTVLFHFNGLIFITAGVGLIIYMRHYRYLTLFIIAAGMIAPIYWYEMASNHAIGIAIDQIKNYPSLSHEGFSLKYLLKKILFSPQRFGQHLFDFTYTLLLVLSIFFCRRTIKENPEVKLLLVYFIVAELTLAIIGPGAKAMYLVLHMPFVLFIITVLNPKITQKPAQRTMLIAFSLYAITQIGHVYGLISHRNSEIIEQHAQIVDKYHIRKSDKILAPAVFVFNEIDNARIGATENLSGFSPTYKVGNTRNAIFAYAMEYEYQFLILRQYFLADFSDEDLNLGQVHLGYQVVGKDYGYHIFRRVP